MAATNHTAGSRNGDLDHGLEQHKGPGRGAPRAFGSARRSAGQERADGLAVTRREASRNTTCT